MTAQTEPMRNLLALHEAATLVLADFECDHRNQEHGNCADCMNHGYIVTCEQEQDIFTACLSIVRATDDLKADQ